MRWRQKPKEDLDNPRRRSGFLWWPRKIDGQTRWLEWAAWQQTYGIAEYYMSLPIYGWRDSRWLSK